MPAEPGEPLSEREIEIVELVAAGLTNREIAIRTYLSPNTVKVHLRNIFTKTGVASRTELTVLAMQEGWIAVPGATEAPAGAVASIPAEASVQMEPALPALPPWPRARWAALAAGLIVALVALLLPRQPAGQAAVPTASGLVDQTTAEHVADAPVGDNGGARWDELTPLPVRRARMGVAAQDNSIYVVGGSMEDGPTGRLDIYDVDTALWRSGAPRPAALANVGIVALPEKAGNPYRLLVPGGCDASGAPQAITHLYDPESDTWSEGAPLPQPLCAYALTEHDGRAYLFGGWNGAAYQAVGYVYDSGSNTWTEIAHPAGARGFGAAATLVDANGLIRIFYVGGYDDEREWATCEVYLPEANRWDGCAPMLLPRGGLGLAAIGARVYAIGGGWTAYLGFNERYDPATDTWTVVQTPIVGEWRNLGLVAYDTSLYVVGGWSGDYLNRVYAIEVLPWRVFIPTTFFSP